MRKIKTDFIYPPIPVRCYDWRAVFDDCDEIIGYGSTKEEAIQDLLESVS
jgi:hypothetical protein